MKSNLTLKKEAFKLASIPYEFGEPTFTEHNSIYIASTANVKDTLNLYSGYNKVLSVGSTGSHGYEAALNGATKVDMFDINELQRLYYEYMEVAITYLNYEKFVKHFTLKKQSDMIKRSELKDLLSQDLYEQLVYFLPPEVENVFSALYDYYDSVDLICSKLFRFEHVITLEYLKRNISFYNEEQYYKLQQILRSEKCQFNYQIASLTDVPKEFKDKYDLIILDNILQYYKNITGLESPYLINMFIRKKLGELLTEDGKIQVNYGFEVATDALKEKYNIPYDKNGLDIIKKIIIQDEIKNGPNIPLVEKWDNYTYSFIPGVEQTETHNSDNVVLTYKKR